MTMNKPSEYNTDGIITLITNKTSTTLTKGTYESGGQQPSLTVMALRHNWQRIRELTPDSRHVAVVKANAYSHGLVRNRP